jgi:hypothetical protein
MTARIRRNFKIDIPARVVFEFPTIAALAQQLEKAEAPSASVRSSLLQRPRATDREAILHQLDRLPAEDAETLLKSMLDQKRAERPPFTQSK